jgi:threonine/homoserine/homoserine lactone efflux protein
MSTALAGFALGFAVAAGFGPISVLALTSGLRHGFAPAFGVGLGAAFVDGLYALLAGLGLAALVPGDELQLVGGLALLWIGWRMVGAAGGGGPALATFKRGLSVSFAATLANPLTIVSWAAAFTAVVPGLGVSRTATLTVLPACVALGTLTWFTGLAAASAFAGRRFGPDALRVASVVAGLAIIGFGLVFVLRGASEVLTS